jgi:restriction system protein
MAECQETNLALVDSPENSSPLLPHGGYRKLRSYKVAEAVYDATVVFCRRFFQHDRRMTDHMVQAARSGVRNISEGSGMAATSRKSELKLTNVARASLSDELLRDANAMVCAVNQAAYLLKRQIESQGQAFLEKGEFTEKLYGARKRTLSDRSDKPPACPNCGKPMALRTARKGQKAGQPFWGCTGFPDCKGARLAESQYR